MSCQRAKRSKLVRTLSSAADIHYDNGHWPKGKVKLDAYIFECLPMYQLLFTGQLFSVNKTDSEKKVKYQAELQSLFRSKYGSPEAKGFYSRNDKCYFLITYFYKGRLCRDIDNILKHTIDAFIKQIYPDDRCVKFCLSQAVQCDNTITPIDITNLDDDIIEQIYKFLENSTYKGEETAITYMECGLMTEKFYHTNLEELWK